MDYLVRNCVSSFKHEKFTHHVQAAFYIHLNCQKIFVSGGSQNRVYSDRAQNPSQPLSRKLIGYDYSGCNQIPYIARQCL